MPTFGQLTAEHPDRRALHGPEAHRRRREGRQAEVGVHTEIGRGGRRRGEGGRRRQLRGGEIVGGRVRVLGPEEGHEAGAAGIGRGRGG